MQKISTVSGLKNAIQELTLKQAQEWPLLREELFKTYQSARPVNLIKSTLRELAETIGFKEDVLNTAGGLLAACLSKKVVTGPRQSLLEQFSRNLLQVAVVCIASKSGNRMKSTVLYLINTIFSKKDTSV